MNSRRRVNSTVIAPRTNGKTCSWNHRLNGFAFGARLGADETWVVGRRYNKSLDRSAFSRLFIRKTRMPGSLFPRPVNSTVRHLLNENEKASFAENSREELASRPVDGVSR